MTMISVDDAISVVRSHVPSRPSRQVPVDRALQTILAADVVSSDPLPRFDKALMDGVALRAGDFAFTHGRWRIVGTITAGDSSMPDLPAGHAFRIMTGAMLPCGADTVIPREQLHSLGSDSSVGSDFTLSQPPRQFHHVLRAGEIARSGEVVVPAGTLITAGVRAFLMELGLATVLVYPPVTVAVLATGNELLDWPQQLPLGHAYNTNGPMLVAMAEECDCQVRDLGIVRDDAALLSASIQTGLEAELLILSGGVSVGDLDLVPKTLADLGVQPRFHGVAAKPGKPIWFGIHERGTLVFGLPGNPLSVFVGFHLFVRAALSGLTHRELDARWSMLPLASDHKFAGDRETYWPARYGTNRATLSDDANEHVGVQILPWRGSSDLRTLALATGLVRFPAGNRQYSAGEHVAYTPLSTPHHVEHVESHKIGQSIRTS